MSKTYLGVVAAIFIGIATVVGAELAKNMNPFVMIVGSCMISAFLLFPFAFLVKEQFQFKELLKHKKDFLKVVLARSTIGTILLTFGFSLTPAVKAVLLFRAEAIFVLIFSYFLLREEITKKKILLLIALVIGSFLVITSGNLSIFNKAYLGDVLIISAMVLMAYSYIVSRKVVKKVNSTTLTFSANLISGIVLLPLLFFIPFEITRLNLIYLIAYSVLFFVVGLYLFFKSLKFIKPWVVSSLMSLQIIVGVVFAIIWLKEPLTIIQGIGGFLVLISSYFISKE